MPEAGQKRPRDSEASEEMVGVSKSIPMTRSESIDIHVDGMPKMDTFPSETTMFSYFLGDRLKEGKGKNVALIDARNGKKYTYTEVHKQALGCAAMFREAGLQMEQRALLMLKNIPELVLGYWGVHALGSVVTMAVPWLEKRELYSHFLTYTRARVAVAPYSMIPMLKDLAEEQRYLRVVFVVDDGEVDTKASEYKLGEAGPVKFVDFQSSLDEALKSKKDEDKTLIPPDLCADDIALWYFTSGTTGLPKGCVHLQHDMCCAARSYGQITMQLRESDLTFASSPMVGPYAMGSNCLFPFSVGASCLLDGKGKGMDADAMFDLIEQFDVTVGVTAPNLIRAMCAHERKAAGKASVGKLRYITSAGRRQAAFAIAVPCPELTWRVPLPGDVLYAADYNRWKSTFDVEILDGIGTSELQHIFISNTLEPNGVKPGSVGKRVPGYRVRIVTDKGENADVGEVGELRIKADSNSLMYWNQHEKSKEVFLGDSYKTGDLAYVDSDGFYFLCGRSTDLKSMFSDGKRDLRISPFRLEDELLSHPAIMDVAVVDVADGLDEVQITDSTEYSGALEKEIPEYLISRVGPLRSPLIIRIVPNIPRNARDKVERTLLRNLHFSIFCAVDTDHSGTVERKEFKEYLEKVDSSPHSQVLKSSLEQTIKHYNQLFDKYDTDGDGKLTFPEFREMVNAHETDLLGTLPSESK